MQRKTKEMHKNALFNVYAHQFDKLNCCWSLVGLLICTHPATSIDNIVQCCYYYFVVVFFSHNKLATSCAIIIVVFNSGFLAFVQSVWASFSQQIAFIAQFYAQRVLLSIKRSVASMGLKIAYNYDVTPHTRQIQPNSANWKPTAIARTVPRNAFYSFNYLHLLGESVGKLQWYILITIDFVEFSKYWKTEREGKDKEKQHIACLFYHHKISKM